MTTLIACSHGTRSAAGRDTVRTLVDQVRTLLPGTRVEEAFVDVQVPDVADVVARVAADSPAVVVPLLLSSGFHTNVDIALAVRPFSHVTAAPALGPHDLLIDVLVARLSSIGLRVGDAVVLAAAGSTDPAAADDVRAVADRLRNALRVPVTAAYAAGARPWLASAVTAARESGALRVVAASYVLAPGHFASLIADAGADAVTAPLAPDARLAQIVVDRFHEASSRAGFPC